MPGFNVAYAAWRLLRRWNSVGLLHPGRNAKTEAFQPGQA